MMFRSKRTRWQVVIVGVVLAAILGSLGSVQAQQAAEKSRLGSELALVEESLNGSQEGAGSGQEEMENRLSESSLDLSNAKAQLSRSTDSIIANETLFDLARASGVEITGITVSPVDTEDLGDVACSALPVTVIVEGDVPQLIDFIMTLNTSVTNGLVMLAGVTVPDNMTEEQKPRADIRLIIYSYEGE